MMNKDKTMLRAFITIFFFTGFIAGVCIDIIPTFLYSSKETLSVVGNYSVFMGIGCIIGAVISVNVYRIAYRKLILGSIILLIVSFVFFQYSSSNLLLSLAIIWFSVGLFIFDIISIPFIDKYTNQSNKTASYTKLYISNMVGMSLGMLIGGISVVYRFSQELDITYVQAKNMTTQLSELSSEILDKYLDSYSLIFVVSIAVLAVCIIPALLIKESVGDHPELYIKGKLELKKIVKEKSALIFIAISAVSSIAFALILPYFSITFTSLGLDRQNISIIMIINGILPIAFIRLYSLTVRNRSIIGVRSIMQVVSGLIFLSIFWFRNDFLVLVTVLLILIGNGVYSGLKGLNAEILMSESSENMKVTVSSINFVAMGFAQILGGVIFNNFIFKLELPFIVNYLIAAIAFIVCGILIKIKFKESKRMEA